VPCCQVQLRVTADKKGVSIEVQDSAHFAAATFGYTFPIDPEVRSSGRSSMLHQTVDPKGSPT